MNGTNDSFRRFIRQETTLGLWSRSCEKQPWELSLRGRVGDSDRRVPGKSEIKKRAKGQRPSPAAATLLSPRLCVKGESWQRGFAGR